VPKAALARLAVTVPAALGSIAAEIALPPRAEALVHRVQLAAQLVGSAPGSVGRVDARDGAAEALQLRFCRPPGAAVALDVAARLAHEPSHMAPLGPPPGRDAGRGIP